MVVVVILIVVVVLVSVFIVIVLAAIAVCIMFTPVAISVPVLPVMRCRTNGPAVTFAAALFARLSELAAAVLRLRAVFAMFVDVFAQIVFGLADAPIAAVERPGRNGAAKHHESENGCRGDCYLTYHSSLSLVACGL